MSYSVGGTTFDVNLKEFNKKKKNSFVGTDFFLYQHVTEGLLFIEEPPNFSHVTQNQSCI